MKKITPIFVLCFLAFQSGNLYSQYCYPFEIEEIDFQAETKFVKVDAQW